jgi:hypothetical protein
MELTKYRNIQFYESILDKIPKAEIYNKKRVAWAKSYSYIYIQLGISSEVPWYFFSYQERSSPAINNMGVLMKQYKSQ